MLMNFLVFSSYSGAVSCAMTMQVCPSGRAASIKRLVLCLSCHLLYPRAVLYQSRAWEGVSLTAKYSMRTRLSWQRQALRSANLQFQESLLDATVRD